MRGCILCIYSCKFLYLPSCLLIVKPYSGCCGKVMLTPTRGEPSCNATLPRITATRLEKQKMGRGEGAEGKEVHKERER